MSEIKVGVVTFAAIGAGVGVASLLTGLLMGMGGLFVVGILVLASLGVAPGLAAILALRQVDRLDETEDRFLFANAAVTGLVGTLVLGVIAGLFGTIASSLVSPGGAGGASTGGGMTPVPASVQSFSRSS
jgi:hypothetical protein